MATLAEASKVNALDANTYAAVFHRTFQISKVPHGGYVATCFLRVAAAHLGRGSRDQPDTMTAHLEYLDRAQVGPAIFRVEELKTGSQTTVLQITLYQAREGSDGTLPASSGSELPSSLPLWLAEEGAARRAVVGYVTNTNFDRLNGLTLDTGFRLYPAPPARPSSFEQMWAGRDPEWCRYAEPAHHRSLRQPAFRTLEYYSPRAEGQGGAMAGGVLDRWIRFASGERFSSASLGFVADAWPLVVESHRPRPPADGAEESEASQTPFPWDALFWYPTLSINLEVKRRLAEPGPEWLFFRVQTKEIRNGRMDMEIVVLDDAGDLVALASHVCLVLEFARNLAGRTRRPTETTRSTRDKGGLAKGTSRI